MSNQISTFAVKSNFFGTAISMGNNEKKNVRGLGNGLTKYAAQTENVQNQEFYVGNPRKAANVANLDRLKLGKVRVAPTFYRIDGNTNWIPNLIFMVDDIENGGKIKISDFKKSEKQIPKITMNGDVTSFIDFEETFGTFDFYGATPEYYRDNVSNQLTDEVDHYVATLYSSKLDEVYLVDILDVDSKVLSLDLGSKVNMSEATARVFRSAAEVDTGVTSISMKCKDLSAVKETSKSTAPSQPSSSSQNQESNKPKNN